MKSIIFIAPYFGKFPPHFDLWLRSCKENLSIHWLIITNDHSEHPYPSNVRVKYTTFPEFIEMIEERVGFTVYASSPYKLCDIKPLYGYIMQDEIREYDYWGHCDSTDTIFGDLRGFFTDEALDGADKIMFLGHMTLYRNTDEVNERFWLSRELGKPVEKILQSSENHQYDEFNSCGINAIYWAKGFSMKRMDSMIYDISAGRHAFQRICYDEEFHVVSQKKVPTIIYWNKGKLYALSIMNHEIKQHEFGYVHFQKRKMECDLPFDTDRFFIIPNRFVDIESIGIELSDSKALKEYMRKVSRDKLFYKPWLIGKFNAAKYYMKKIMGKYDL